MDPLQANPQGMTGTWVQAEGGKRGIKPSRETAVDAGTRRGEKVRVAEDGGWRVREMSRWAALFTRRGGGERMKNERSLMMNDYGWGGGRKERELKI